MRIARVFPRKTNMTPYDTDTYFGQPGLFTPVLSDVSVYDEVHISVTFTWDKPYAEQLRQMWSNHGRKVLVGGPAYDDKGNEFIAMKGIL